MLTFTTLVALSSVLAFGPCPDASKETCFRGGIISVPCNGASCPPCWVPQEGKVWGCYEKLVGQDGSATCPPWPGVVDITNLPTTCLTPTSNPTQTLPKPTVNPTDPPVPSGKPTVCPNVGEDTCFRGGYRAYPCKGVDCPRCWEYKNLGWDCYDPVKGKCEWDNLIDILNPPTECAAPTVPTPKPTATSNPTQTPVPSGNPTVCPNVGEDTCFQGGYRAYPCKGKECPRCWEYKNKGWDCYDPVNGMCEWDNLIDILNPPLECAASTVPTPKPTATSNPTRPAEPTGQFTICPSVGEDTCFRGGYRAYPCKGKDCPRCWEYKNKEWDCYDPINGKCEWATLVDILNLPANCQLPECE